MLWPTFKVILKSFCCIFYVKRSDFFVIVCVGNKANLNFENLFSIGNLQKVPYLRVKTSHCSGDIGALKLVYFLVIAGPIFCKSASNFSTDSR